MSDRACNYCNHKELLREAKKKGDKITTKPSTERLGGVDVYRNGKWIRWYMALPTQCAC